MTRTSPLSAAVLGLALLAAAASAHADGDRRVPPLPVYQQECGSCHVAFPARGLPAASWQRVMGGLSRHYGTDASLDAATTRQIADWLQANAGRRADTPPEDRLTRSAWFVREHDELSPAVWKRAAVKSPVNCAACHGAAAEGRFSEHDVRIPK